MRRWERNDKFFGAQEAKDYGLVDEVIEKPQEEAASAS